MKIGEVVIYTEGTDPKTKQPLEYKALVLGERNIADHLGKNDEPLLSLVFVKERFDLSGVSIPLHGTGMQERLIQTRLDVAHESHEYTKPQQKQYGRTAYEGGRWREARFTPKEVRRGSFESNIGPGSGGAQPDSGDKKEA